MTGTWDETGRPAEPTPPPPPPLPGYVPPSPGSYGPVDDRYPAPGLPAPPPPRTPVRYADWGERVGATLVDWALIFAPVFALAVVAPEVVSDALGGWLWLAGAAWVAWLNGSKGQSPGKALMGIKVVREADGSTLGGPVGLVRSLVLMLMLVLGMGVGWVLSVLWPLWNPRHRALHDMVVSASVVAGYPRARPGKGIFLP